MTRIVINRPTRLFAACLLGLPALLGLPGVAPARAQAGAAAPPQRTHVERFSTPEMLAERAEAEAERKLAADPNDVEALDARALARMRRGRYGEAYEDLRRAVALKPQSAELRASLGYALWRLGRVTEAVASEREALRLDGKNFTAHYQLGRFLLRTGDPAHLPEVASLLARAVELDPRQYDVRFELIETYRRTGDVAKALAQLDLLQDARPADPRVTYVAAILAADRGDMEAAVSGFLKALRQDANLYGVRQDLGVAYVKLGRWKEAVEVFSELVRREPQSVESAYLHALALFNSGRGGEAEAEARRALRLNAGAAEAHSLLGIILASRGGGSAEAAESLQQAAALDPSNFDARFYLGRVLYAARDYEGAVRSLREAVALKPKHAEARFFLGTVLEAAGDSASALAEYQTLAAAEPESAYGLLGTGALLVRRGKLDEALAALNRAASLAPSDFEAHLALGRAHALKEQFAEAVSALERAVSLAPDRADAHYQLGLALRRLGRTEEAAREFRIVERLNTEFRTNTPARP
ncbi:MAG TPA: tetratricopeptide repeat protein [Pyrinomonadaceae bacterium]|nr:tetratricopeptide repeat protein [Pyrinomonadaceae bacterium]